MLIAFTHNLKTSEREEEAEFDSKETVMAIAEGLISLGHQVELIEVSGPVSNVVGRLEALHPDLVFNTAEGLEGKYREAFYPGVFDQLGLPYTGSDAYTCALTLDKDLTKAVLREKGIPVPQSQLIKSKRDIKTLPFKYPMILKPNYEGSSKGITQDSIVESLEDLVRKLPPLLEKYKSGILVEEYIVGKDVAIPFIQGAAKETHGVLPAIEYMFDPKFNAKRKYSIYDYDLKNTMSQYVSIKVPAAVSEKAHATMVKYAQTILQELNIKDFGRIDFRVTDKDEVYFIEVNALPSLEPGAGIYTAAEKVGLSSVPQVLNAIINSAKKRFKMNERPRRKLGQLRVGFAYNEKKIVPSVNPITDIEAEFDSPKTLNAIRDAIRSYGHEVVDLEATPDIPDRLSRANVDIVFNIAEGIRGRYRESQIPALCDLMDIEYTGSDAATLAITLDKGMAKRIVREAGLLTPNFFLFVTGKEKLPADFTYPAIAKPVAEGSSKGVWSTSVVRNEEELKEIVRTITGQYRQAALVEEFLPGREFTVALLGEKRPKALPPMEIIFKNKNIALPVYSYEHKLDVTEDVGYKVPADVDDKLRKQIEQLAKKAFIALGCRDVARVDIRLDAQGRPQFIECNPLPGLTPSWSDLCMIAESTGMSYNSLIGEIMAPAIKRYKTKQAILLQKEAP